MASRFPLRMQLHLLGISVFLMGVAIDLNVRAGEAALHRTEFQHCSDLDTYPALDHVHPSKPKDRGNVHFYYIAVVELCADSPRVSVRHSVKNLHSKPLKFSWEGTTVFHRGLKGGKSWGEPVFFSDYNGDQIVSQLFYGRSLDYAIAATIYPLPLYPQRAEGVHPDDSLITKLETEYEDAGGETRRIYVEVSSLYQQDEVISYSFIKEPTDLVLALGRFTETSAGQTIASLLVAEVGLLDKFVSMEYLNELPSVFSKEEFLIVPSYAKDFEQIDVPGKPNQIGILPIAVLDKNFQPIATSVTKLFLP